MKSSSSLSSSRTDCRFSAMPVRSNKYPAVICRIPALASASISGSRFSRVSVKPGMRGSSAALTAIPMRCNSAICLSRMRGEALRGLELSLQGSIERGHGERDFDGLRLLREHFQDRWPDKAARHDPCLNASFAQHMNHPGCFGLNYLKWRKRLRGRAQEHRAWEIL